MPNRNMNSLATSGAVARVSGRFMIAIDPTVRPTTLKLNSDERSGFALRFRFTGPGFARCVEVLTRVVRIERI